MNLRKKQIDMPICERVTLIVSEVYCVFILNPTENESFRAPLEVGVPFQKLLINARCSLLVFFVTHSNPLHFFQEQNFKRLFRCLKRLIHLVFHHFAGVQGGRDLLKNRSSQSRLEGGMFGLVAAGHRAGCLQSPVR